MIWLRAGTWVVDKSEDRERDNGKLFSGFDDNGDGVSHLEEIEKARLKLKREDVGEMNLAESNRVLRLRRVGVRGVRLSLSEVGEDEERNLSMASLLQMKKKKKMKKRRLLDRVSAQKVTTS